MPRENIDVVRSIYAPWQHGDFSSAPWAHPNIEYVWVDGPAPGRWTGLAGMAESWREILSAWEGFYAQVEEYRELDEERVAVFFQFRGRGKASGLDLGELHASGVSIYDIRDGQVTRIVSYFDRDRALTELGIARPSGHEYSYVAMASRNEEVLRRAFAAWNARDMEALRELIDPEFEFAPHITGGFEGIDFHGLDGLERFICMSDEAWESMRVEPSEVRHSGDVVVALGHLRARGRSSGVEVNEPTVWVGQLRNGRALRLEARSAADPAAIARALADAGLPPDTFDP